MCKIIENTNQFESFVDFIIKENPFVCERIREKDVELTVDINSKGNSGSIVSMSEIQFGLTDHDTLFELFCIMQSIMPFDNIIYTVQPDSDSASIRIFYEWSKESGLIPVDHIGEILSKVKFYKQDNRAIPFKVYRGACSYILYHEIGHVLYDKNIPLDYDKELRADKFAFNAILSSAVNPREQDAGVWGALLGLFNILYKKSPIKIKEDAVHPHPLERIETFLEMAQISSDSPLWNVSCRMINEYLSRQRHEVKPIPEKCTRDTFDKLKEYVISLGR